jgi:prolyl-tRNA editing enzyme YbaK/EbsC (Cys-tRNA(Pro) deacylase)
MRRLYNRRAFHPMCSASAVLSSPSVERVRQALERAGMRADIIELPGAARTARAAADFLTCDVAQIANSLVFRAQPSDTAILVLSSGAGRVDTVKLSRLVGEATGKADADFVRRHTGFAIGGVAPVGHGVSKVFVDKMLARYPELWAAGGHPHTVFRLTYAELVRITGGSEAEVST